MKKILILIFMCFYSQNIFANENLDKKAREINKKIRCVVCQSQSIDDSDSILARDLRVLIKEKLKEGKNEKEITDYLVERYGEFILLKPRNSVFVVLYTYAAPCKGLKASPESFCAPTIIYTVVADSLYIETLVPNF